MPTFIWIIPKQKNFAESERNLGTDTPDETRPPEPRLRSPVPRSPALEAVVT